MGIVNRRKSLNSDERYYGLSAKVYKCLGIKQRLWIRETYFKRPLGMKEWKKQPISREWILNYLEGNPLIWTLEHVGCEGAVSYDHKKSECMSCKHPVEKKDLVTIQLVINKDRIKM